MAQTAGVRGDPVASPARRFHGRRKVRLGDVRTSGHLRLDALTRYTQDVSDDDTTSGGLDPEPGWIVRRTMVAIGSPAVLGEELEFVTYCSALGGRWAERRLDITGSDGAAYEVVTLWVCVDPTTGRPQRLTEQFLALYASSAEGRTVSARLTHPKVPTGARRRPWPLRAVDFDVYGHVNNAAYWAVFEETFGRLPGPVDEASIEYGTGVEPHDDVTLVAETLDDGSHATWLLGRDGALAASLLIRSRTTSS